MDRTRRAAEAAGRAGVVTVTGVEGEAPSRRGMQMAVLDDGTVFGTLGCDGFDREGAASGLAAIAAGGAVTQRLAWGEDGSITIEARRWTAGTPWPAPPPEIPQLLIVGRGPVARALVTLAEAMGYHVRVAGGPDPPSVGEFEGADEVIFTPDHRSVEALRLSAGTCVVVCGHDRDFSIPSLKALLRTTAPYIGMMGSRRHTGHLIEELRGEGFSESDCARVHTPVGLDLGAETPEEIALSALAEIVAWRRGGGGRPLSGGG